MDWLIRLKGMWPINISVKRETLVMFTKVDVYELEECKPKVIRRERSFFRTDRLDSYHLQLDGSIEIKAV